MDKGKKLCAQRSCLEAAYVGNFSFLVWEFLYCYIYSISFHYAQPQPNKLPLFLSDNWYEASSKKVHPKAQEMELNCLYKKS